MPLGREDGAVRDRFERFFQKEYEPDVRSLTLVFGDRGRAEDAAQAGFERAYRKWRTVCELARPGTWVYVVALRDARRELRQEERALRDDELVPISDGLEDEAVTA